MLMGRPGFKPGEQCAPLMPLNAHVDKKLKKNCLWKEIERDCCAGILTKAKNNFP